jgi:ribosomal protein S13
VLIIRRNVYVDVENDLRSPVARRIREEMMIKAYTNLRILTIFFLLYK